MLVAVANTSGPSYSADNVFDLSQMQPYSLDGMMRAFQLITKDIILYLPRTSDIRQLVAWQDSGQLSVIHYCMKGASKALCTYFGTGFSQLPQAVEMNEESYAL